MGIELDIEFDVGDLKAYFLDRQLRYIGWYKRFLKIQIKLLARDLQRDMKSGVKTGRWYQKSDGSGRYRASAKGETPAVDVGKLLRSVRTKSSEGGLTWVATTGTDYVEDLINMKRQFFKPFFDRRSPQMMESLKAGGFLN